jgi:DNA-directed RNA polymerase specialized sigma subunit
LERRFPEYIHEDHKIKISKALGVKYELIFGGQEPREKYYSTVEVGNIFGVSPLTVNRWHRKGLLKATKINARQSVFYKSNVEKFKKLLEKKNKSKQERNVQHDLGVVLKDMLRTMFYMMLDERRAEVLVMYYGLNNEKQITLKEIGKRLGITRERARQLKESGLEILTERTQRSKTERPTQDEQHHPNP